MIKFKLYFLQFTIFFSFFGNAQDIPKVKIGTQVWMSNNLNVDRFRNGDLIPEAKTNDEWKAAIKNQQPAWAYYENNTSIGIVYGKIYNFYAVYDYRGLAPIGWKVPKAEDWGELTDYLGGVVEALNKLKSKKDWDGNNSSGFLAQPGGTRNRDGYFSSFGEYTTFWSRQDDLDKLGQPSLSSGNSYIGYHGIDSDGGGYVRCLKDTIYDFVESFDQNQYLLSKNEIVLGQSFDFYFNSALFYINKEGENSYNAIVNFEEAIKINPGKGQIYSDLGNCFRGGFKWYKRAEDCYTLAIANWHQEGHVYYNRAFCRYQLQDFIGMRKDLKAAKRNNWLHDPYNLNGK